MEQLSEVFERLGGITPAVGEEFNPLSVEDIAQIRERFAHDLPEAIVEILSNYGAIGFNEYVYCRTQTSFLPIADSGGGDVFGVDLSNGNVMYWSHDNPNIEFTLLSKSFVDWLSTLET